MNTRTNPFYHSWTGMKARCADRNRPDFKNYGGRGITYCKEWETFDGFSRDMLASYQPGLTLDRIDVNGNYEPGNCRWVDRKTQATNRRNTRLFDFDGQSHTLTDWSPILGIKRSTLAQRIYVYGWDVLKAFTT